MVLPILAYGDPILHREAELVEKDSPEIRQLIDNMIETMENADGAGLAAPQIGKNLRIFVADLTPAVSSLSQHARPSIPPQPMVCINPEIIFSSKEKEEFEEGCLSIPNLVERIPRPNKIELRYLDRSFNPQTIAASGPLASVLQHENDHLDGVLHIDYLTTFRKRLIKKELKKISRGDFEADYPMQVHENKGNEK